MKTKAHTARILAFFGLIALMLTLPAAALAQDTITLDFVRVRVWPEYDQPSALVIVNGQAVQETPEPVELRFTIPEQRELFIVAYIELDSGLPNDNVVWRTEGSDLIIESPNGTFWFEFYDQALAFDGTQRSYALEWSPGYAVNDFIWAVQSPVGASNMVVDPSEGGVMGNDPNTGLPTYTVSTGALAAGEAASLSFSYTKADDTLSVDSGALALPDMPADPQTAVPAADDDEPSPLLIAALIALGLILIGGGILWYLRADGVFERRAQRSPVKPSARVTGQRFCTQCGKPLGIDDRFCRHCGAKTRGS